MSRVLTLAVAGSRSGSEKESRASKDQEEKQAMPREAPADTAEEKAAAAEEETAEEDGAAEQPAC